MSRLDPTFIGLRLTVLAIVAVSAVTGSAIAAATCACVITLAWVVAINHATTTTISSNYAPRIAAH